MRQGFYTHNRIREELGEEEDSPHLVVGNPIIRWLHQDSQTTRWEPPGDRRQYLEQAALMC